MLVLHVHHQLQHVHLELQHVHHKGSSPEQHHVPLVERMLMDVHLLQLQLVVMLHIISPQELV